MRCWPNQGSHTEIPVQATQRREGLIRTSAEQNYQRARTPAGGPVASDSPKGPNCQSVARKVVRTRSARKTLAVASRPWRTSRVLVGRCMHEPDQSYNIQQPSNGLHVNRKLQICTSAHDTAARCALACILLQNRMSADVLGELRAWRASARVRQASNRGGLLGTGLHGCGYGSRAVSYTHLTLPTKA